MSEEWGGLREKGKAQPVTQHHMSTLWEYPKMSMLLMSLLGFPILASLNALCGKDRTARAVCGIYPAGCRCSQDSDGSAPLWLLSRRVSKQYSSCFRG